MLNPPKCLVFAAYDKIKNFMKIDDKNDARNVEMETGKLKLEARNWEMELGNWKNRKMEPGSRTTEAGRRKKDMREGRKSATGSRYPVAIRPVSGALRAKSPDARGDPSF